MRYWVFDERTQQALGPYFIARFKTLYGFGPESKVAPSGSTSKKDWLKAKEVPEFQPVLEEIAKLRPPEPPPEAPEPEAGGKPAPQKPEPGKK